MFPRGGPVSCLLYILIRITTLILSLRSWGILSAKLQYWRKLDVKCIVQQNCHSAYFNILSRCCEWQLPWCNYCVYYHDDVIKWKYFPCYWPCVRRIHRSPVNYPHKGQWRVALMFSLICTGCSNNRYAGDSRRYRAHFGATIMT